MEKVMHMDFPSSQDTILVQRSVTLHNRSKLGLGAITLLSAFLNFFLLGQNGYGNIYYASSVRSMADSWHNFFFTSFDPGGFVSIDKPPVGFWLQVLSSKIFGFSPFSLLLPQAINGVLAVLLLYYLVQRHFGPIAGLIAALMLAITPVSVLTSRNLTIDSTLVLVILLSVWAVIHAAETGKLLWLLLSAAFVGLGFSIKMAEALLIVPTLVLTYFLCAPIKMWRRILYLLLFTMVLLIVSLLWIEFVDHTPTTQRPFVGSTKNNSELTLALTYNGLNRFSVASSSEKSTSYIPGTPGPLRLFTVELGGQLSWFLPFALIGILALIITRPPDFQKDRQQLSIILWGTWLLVMLAFFSIDKSFHQYYLTEMAPGLSAVVGISLPIIWHHYIQRGWSVYFLPIALLMTAVGQIYMLINYPGFSSWLIPLISVSIVLTVIILLFLHLGLNFTWGKNAYRTAGVAASLAMLTLIVAPTIWTSYSVVNNIESAFPVAGPAPFSSKSTISRDLSVPISLLTYLTAKQGKTKYLVGTQTSYFASPIILATNKPVMAIGGFNGHDPILTVNNIRTFIKTNTVRLFLISSTSAIQRQSGANTSKDTRLNTISHWVVKQCTAVPVRYWQSTSTSENAILRDTLLYDCTHQASRS